MRTDHFKVILEILGGLEAQLNSEYIDWSIFSADALSMTAVHWNRVLIMMQDDGLIKGFKHISNGNYSVSDVRITLSGLRYLRDNRQG